MRMLEPVRHDRIEQRRGPVPARRSEYGWAGFLIYWFGYGFIATKVFRAFQVGNLAGLTLYPLVYMSILEVPA